MHACFARGLCFAALAAGFFFSALAPQSHGQEAVQAHGLEIRVNVMRTYATLADEFGEQLKPVKGAFLGAQVTVYNNGSGPQQLDPGMFRLKDSQGEVYPASPYSDKRLFSRPLGPGNTAQGILYFDGPAESAGLSLVFVVTKPVGGPLLAEMALTPAKRPAIPNEVLAPGRRVPVEQPDAVARYAAAAGPHDAGRFVFAVTDAELRRTQREMGHKRPRLVRTTLVAVRFAAQNTQLSPQRLDPGMFRLRDSGGRDYPAHFYTDKSVFETDVAPGATFRGELVFEAPSQGQGLVLALDAGVEKLVEIYPAASSL
jgi:hypothetical protein